MWRAVSRWNRSHCRPARSRSRPRPVPPVARRRELQISSWLRGGGTPSSDPAVAPDATAMSVAPSVPGDVARGGPAAAALAPPPRPPVTLRQPAPIAPRVLARAAGTGGPGGSALLVVRHGPAPSPPPSPRPSVAALQSTLGAGGHQPSSTTSSRSANAGLHLHRLIDSSRSPRDAVARAETAPPARASAPDVGRIAPGGPARLGRSARARGP
jgi:hypothetical protein